MNEQHHASQILRQRSKQPARALADFWPIANADIGQIIVADLEDRSDRIQPGDAWLCLPGAAEHCRQYMDDALQAGAVLCVYVGVCPLDDAPLPVCNVADMDVLGDLLRHWFSTEQTSVRYVGVTGTDGKTSVTWMLRQALQQAAYTTWSLGTLGWMDHHGRTLVLGNTTTSLLNNHRLLAAADDEAVDIVVMEVSSHGIDQQRVSGLPFATVIWTTMGRDHLDYHQHAEGYIACKAQFVNDALARGIAVVGNADQAEIVRQLRSSEAVHWYAEAGTRLSALQWQSVDSNTLCLKWSQQDMAIHPVPGGKIHGQNMAAVAACLCALGITAEKAARSLQGISPPPGRLQVLADGYGRTVLIDYAHTAEALAASLKAARSMTKQHLLLVFGCGGCRDQEKRPQMGAVAAQLADHIWLTSDNPRDEQAEKIIADIRQGMGEVSALSCQADRRLAIANAIAHLQADDVLLIAGKGHEDYMEFEHGRRIPWSDAQIAGQLLKEQPC